MPPRGRSRQTASKKASFVDGLREAIERLPAGLLRFGAPASAERLAAVEQRLERPLPQAYAEFLRHYDGADLFHENILLFSVSGGFGGDLPTRNQESAAPGAVPEAGHHDEIIIGESADGDRFVLEVEAPETHDDPRVFRVGHDPDDRWLAGSSFPRWIAAVIAHEALLYDDDGEFLPEAFEPDGEELTAVFALRQAERALRKDPGSALYQHERGLALRRMDKLESARQAFQAAAAADPSNPWPWFDLGRADQALARHAQAAAAFECAAEAADGPEGARFCAWAARAFHLAGDRATAERLRAVALERDPDLVASLRAAAKAALEDEDAGTARDAEELATLLSGGPLVRKLPLLAPSGRGAKPAAAKAAKSSPKPPANKKPKPKPSAGRVSEPRSRPR